MDLIDLKGTPYLLDAVAGETVGKALGQLNERVEILRTTERLTEQTLKLYYGQTRFEQIAESNAIEGSTLSVGETELAVMKGITISGHDPGYSRDAQALARALDELAEMARLSNATDIQQVKSLHEIILGDRPSAGNFRNEEVRISGSRHRPPRNWNEVMTAMEQWQAWSLGSPSVPPVLRSAVLHAWLVHVHPFLDGNGRTARAVGNLELIRAGYPPLIIRARKDRSRYLEALRASDDGDITLFLDLLIERAFDALRDLERAAKRGQGYDAQTQLLRKAQERRLGIWDAAVALLVEMVGARLHDHLDSLGTSIVVHRYQNNLDLNDYLALCEGQAISRAWTFRIECEVPGLHRLSWLAWAGFRSRDMVVPPGEFPSPSLFWSEPNPEKYPAWRRMDSGGPGGDELTLVGDRWLCLKDGQLRSFSSLDLADEIAANITQSLAGPEPK